MKTITIITTFAVAALVVFLSFDTPAEAKKYRPAQVAKNIGKSVGNTARKATKGISRSARWSANAVWVGTGLGTAHAVVSKNCNYYYRRYQETRNPKWRNKYNACI